MQPIRALSGIAFGLFALAVALQFCGGAAAQQAYPTRAVRFILPFNPASATDITARMFADRLSHAGASR